MSSAKERDRCEWKSARGCANFAAHVNIILFSSEEIAARTDADGVFALPRADARAAHILEVLRREPGDTLDVGVFDGPRGKATLSVFAGETHSEIGLTFVWGAEPEPLPPVTLIVGLPRPQTARKILNEATALGVSALHFVGTERGEPSYAQSTLWTTGEYRRHVAAGVAQAFCTRLPSIQFSNTLAATLAEISARPNPAAVRCLALDNYESPALLSEILAKWPRACGGELFVLVIGSERGWTGNEREQLRAAGFAFAHLGPRVLRTETAVCAGLALVLAHLRKL